MTDARRSEIDAFLQSYRALSYDEAEARLERLATDDPELHDLVEEAMEAAEAPDLLPPSPVRAPEFQEVRPGSVLRNRYEVLKRLGKGGQGSVFLARDITHPESEVGPRQRLVAVKAALDPTSRTYLRKEAEMLMRLDHNHLPRVELVEPSGAFVVMEYVEGTSLQSAFEARGRAPYDWETVAEWMSTVLSVLSHLHSPPPPPPEPEDPFQTRLSESRLPPRRTTPYVHCDIKPGNLIRKSNGALYVVDLGISKSGDHTLTQRASSDGWGSQGYSPPEMWNPAANVLPQTDLYSLGMTAFELLTGGVAADYARGDGQSEDDFDRALKGAKLGKGVERWIWRATRVSPAERFESAEEMRTELRRIRTGAVRPTRRLLLAVATVLIAVAALGVGYWVLSDASPLVASNETPDGPVESAPDSFEVDVLSSADSLLNDEDDEGEGQGGTDPAPNPGPLPPQQPPPTQPPSDPGPRVVTPPPPATRQVRLDLKGTDVSGVTVNGQPTGARQSLRVGETKRFDVTEGYDVRFAVVWYESGGFDRIPATDGVVSIPIKEGVASIEFDIVADLDELVQQGF